MKSVFLQGEFSNYKIRDLNESRGEIIKPSYFAQRKVNVFISHKHDDLDDLMGLIGFLEKEFNVKAYIDSQDPAMPRKTSGETATILKDRIDECDRFILLATDGAIESKWCNWELGYGDAKKGKKVALLPLKKLGISYTGNEYMEIYSFITYWDGSETYDTGKKVEPGYYVATRTNKKYTITPLGEWLS